MQGKTAEHRTYCHQLKSLWGKRQDHNLKVVGSNLTPATNKINMLAALMGGFLWAQREPNDIVFLAFKRFSKRLALLCITQSSCDGQFLTPGRKQI